MKKILFIVNYIFLAVLYGGATYIVLHLRTTSGLDLHWRQADLFLALNVIFFFPALYTAQKFFRQQKAKKVKKTVNIEEKRQANIRAAQMTLLKNGNEMSERDTGDTLVFVVHNFLVYLGVFVFAVLIDTIVFIKKVLNKNKADSI